MSFDFPANLERDIEQYAHARHISPTEAVVKLLEEVLETKKRTARPVVVNRREVPAVPPVTEDELRQFDAAFPTLGLLDDVTDEEWGRILEAGRKMNKEGFPVRD